MTDEKEVVEAGAKRGLLEVECVIRRKDGSIKSIERSVRPVAFDPVHGLQVTSGEGG
jgi:hypothetical protein